MAVSLMHSEQRLPVAMGPALQDDVLLEIFGFLSAQGLIQAALVNRQWKKLVFDPISWSPRALPEQPKLKITNISWPDPTVVFRVDLNAMRPSPRDQRALTCYLSWKFEHLQTEEIWRCGRLQTQENVEVAVFTVLKGLTINHMLQIGTDPRWGKPITFNFSWDRILEVLGDAPVEETYQVAITMSMLQDTRHQPVTAHQKILKKMGVGWRRPRVIEELLFSLLMRNNSQEDPSAPRDEHERPIYTSCQDRVDGRKVAIGRCYPNKICIARDGIPIGAGLRAARNLSRKLGSGGEKCQKRLVKV